jgi:hypothetical protein
VHYLSQHIAQEGTVATLAGVQPVLAALTRIENGSADPADLMPWATAGTCASACNPNWIAMACRICGPIRRRLR